MTTPEEFKNRVEAAIAFVCTSEVVSGLTEIHYLIQDIEQLNLAELFYKKYLLTTLTFVYF